MDKKCQEKMKQLVHYFKSGEKDPDEFKIGLELEHFVLAGDSFKAVTYHGENGIEGLLSELADKGFEPVYEAGYLLGLKRDNYSIALEPGGQMELSLPPFRSIRESEELYLKIIDEIKPLLEKRNFFLMNTGYQVVSKISEIELLPKERYQHMFNYFKNKGRYAHNMMKGTAALHINLDYCNEEDFRKKIRTAYFLSPLVYYFFDNSPFFEGAVNYNASIRSIIWDNCDNDRCGYVQNLFKEDYSYSDYASYILNTPPIIVMKDDGLLFTGEKLNKDIFRDTVFNNEEIAHLLSMVFPDVRLKKYLEIRVGDSLPYPYNLSYAAFWKGLLYNEKNLDLLYMKALNYKREDLDFIKNSIRKEGIKSECYGIPLKEFMYQLIEMAENGLAEDEQKYLVSIKEMLEENSIPKMKTLSEYEKSGDLNSALAWCIPLRGV